jgi:hypothetical protein
MNVMSAVLFAAPAPVFAYIGIALSIVVIVRGVLGYRRAGGSGRAVGWVLVLFGVAMLIYFIVRLYSWYR